MKKIETIHAVGYVLCHDVTQIIKDKTKGPVFRKGHIVTEEDIPVLLSVGKDHLYVWEKNENMLHENEAAEILFDLCRSEGMKGSEIKEGKIEVIADRDGLLKIDRKKLFAVNSLGGMMIAGRHGDFPVKKGDKIAGTRIIPLVIEKEKMERAKEAAEGGPIFRILPFHKKKTAIVTTGNEVFYGRIKDTFGPVVKEKIRRVPDGISGTDFGGRPEGAHSGGHSSLYRRGSGAGSLYRRHECGPGRLHTGSHRRNRSEGNHLRSAGVAGSDASSGLL